MTRAEKIAAELVKCRDRNGRVTPRAVVARARNSRNVLHSLFVWSDRKAAEMQRLERAREVITQYLVVTVIHRTQKITVPSYTHDPSAERGEQGYTAIADLDAHNAEKMVSAEVDRCVGCITRARGVVSLLDQNFPGISTKLEEALNAIINIRATFQRAAE